MNLTQKEIDFLAMNGVYFFALKGEKIKIYRFSDLKFVENPFKRLSKGEKYGIIEWYD